MKRSLAILFLSVALFVGGGERVFAQDTQTQDTVAQLQGQANTIGQKILPFLLNAWKNTDTFLTSTLGERWQDFKHHFAAEAEKEKAELLTDIQSYMALGLSKFWDFLISQILQAFKGVLGTSGVL